MFQQIKKEDLSNFKEEKGGYKGYTKGAKGKEWLGQEKGSKSKKQKKDGTNIIFF